LCVNDTGIDRAPLCGLLTGKRLERSKVLPGTSHTQFLRSQGKCVAISFIHPTTLGVIAQFPAREGEVFRELAGSRWGSECRSKAEIHLSARRGALSTLRHLPDHVGKSFGFASSGLLRTCKLCSVVCGGSQLT
jgi:hypothetical protein